MLRKLFARRQPEPEPEMPRTRQSAAAHRAEALTRSRHVQAQHPDVKHLTINMSMRSPWDNEEPTMTSRNYGPESLAYFKFICKNPKCVDGGFDLEDEIRELTSSGRVETSGRRVCQGVECSGPHEQRRCHHELNFRIAVTYHPLSGS